MYSYGPPHMTEQKQDGQSLEDRPEAMNDWEE